MTAGSPARRADVSSICIGIDVGGTFTDGVLASGDRVVRVKTPTTPHDVGQGIRQACELLAQREGKSLEELLDRVERFGLGTTAVTNVLASRVGRRVGLVTTRGFETLMPLAKGRRVFDADGFLGPPAPIVPPERIVGIDERVDREGVVIRRVRADDVVAAGRVLVEREHVDVIVVSLLWAFLNPENEQTVVGLLAQSFPGVAVTSAAARNPVIREFERTSLSILNAYVSNAFTGIDSLEEDLRRAGLRVPVLLTHSGGGSITAKAARDLPISLAHSGPAAGVAAAEQVAIASATPNVITCDMGGTSFDIAVVAGRIVRRSRGEIMGWATALPMVDTQSIGAGGGSIAWVDARGMLRVGPRSAGADPGPACYGRGGDDATVTDALVVLGYMDPAQFLGGEMPLQPDLAAAACERLGRQIGLDAEEAAWGVRHIALEEMVRAVRSLVVDRGLDPRTHALLSYGGAGSLFVCEIARTIHVSRVLVPELASVLSAFGCAATDVVRERMRTLLTPLLDDPMLVQKVAQELHAGVSEDLESDHIDPTARTVEFEADLRFERQVWELTLPMPALPLNRDTLRELDREFRARYEQRYGSGVLMDTATVELVNLRARGTGRTVRASIPRERGRPAQEQPAVRSGSRRVRVDRDSCAHLDVPTYLDSDLHRGHTLTGPAIIDAPDTTIWVPESAALRLDENATRIIEVAR